MTLHESIVSSRQSMANSSIGAILIDKGHLSVADAERILFHQKERGMRFGDAAIELGLLSENDVRFALSRQFAYPYLPVADESINQEVIAAYQPFTAVVEQLRVLRSQLMLRWFDDEQKRRMLTVVSPGRGDGRSFMAANLAVVFSQLGEKTLLIDADLRNPGQHRLFGGCKGAGLSDILAGRVRIDDAVVRVSSLLGLSVLPAGALPPNPQELLGSPAFAGTLEQLARDFDAVILDSPAAENSADAQTIAARAGAALVIGRRNCTALAEMRRLAENLRESGTVLVGSVLNDG